MRTGLARPPSFAPFLSYPFPFSALSPSGQIGASFRVSLLSKVSFSLRTGLNKGCVRVWE